MQRVIQIISQMTSQIIARICSRTIAHPITQIVALAALLALGAAASAQTAAPAGTNIAAAPAHETSSLPLATGAIITAENAEQYAIYLPAAAVLALKHGFKIQVLPTRKLQWSAGYQHATEKYSPQVRLDQDGFLANYVAGMPFPLIETNDPQAAAKIAYNWHLGPVLPDDFSLSPWSSNGYLADAEDAAKIVPADGFDSECATFDFLRYAHRTEVDPRPALPSNPDGVEWKARCSEWTTISVGGSSDYGSGIWIRHLDPRDYDEFYSFTESSRRVRRMSDRARNIPDKVCRECHQPYWAYALPKTELYSYRLLGSATILACMSASTEPAGIVSTGDGYRLDQQPFELRRAYMLEMTARKADLEERTIIFIDSEIYVWLAAEFYEHGERVATAIPLWRTHPSPEGGNLFDLAGSFYFPSRGRELFRSVVPAHSSFAQKINTGAVSSRDFTPQLMER